MTKHRKKQSNRCDDCKSPRCCAANRKQFVRPNPHATATEVHRDQPDTKKENDKPAIIKTHRNPEDVRHGYLPFVKIYDAHYVSKAVASVSISGWGSVRATRRSNRGSS